MSTFSTRQAEQEHRLLLAQFQTLQESVARKRQELQNLALELSQKERQLNEGRRMLNQDEARLHDAARKLGRV